MPIRTVTVAEVPAIIELRRSAFAAHASASYAPDQVETLLNDVDAQELLEMAEEARLFVALDGDEILGSGGWGESNVRHVYVHPEHAREGVGSALVAHAEADYLARTGGARIRLQAVLYASGFYERLGYEVVSCERDWDGSEYFAMVKSLRVLE